MYLLAYARQTIRVYLADDHPFVRRGIIDLPETEPGISVVGEATDGEEAVAGTAKLQPDVILKDLVMPKMDGIEAIRRIKANHPDAVAAPTPSPR